MREFVHYINNIIHSESVDRSIMVFQISQIESFIGKIDETIIDLFLLIFTLVSMFLVNYVAQEVTNYNNHVFLTA